MHMLIHTQKSRVLLSAVVFGVCVCTNQEAGTLEHRFGTAGAVSRTRWGSLKDGATGNWSTSSSKNNTHTHKQK
jgi:hypothetical protein